MTIAQAYNRPMLETDLAEIETDPWAAKIREMVARYRRDALPVVNGSFAYSNLMEGPSQTLTCHLYRMWEYASLFRLPEVGEGRCRFADVGGAGAPLSYLLSENGHSGIAIDLQPFAVDLCNYVASVRELPLSARRGDVTEEFGDIAGQFDLVACVSVLEHVPASARGAFLRGMGRLLRPGGVLYLTFDYGTYREEGGTYLRHDPGSACVSESIDDLDGFCGAVLEAGFTFVGNDPRTLPGEIRAQKSAPGRTGVMRRLAMNVGAVDGATPWPVLAKYLVRRLFRYPAPGPSRFDRHNFFRMFLRKE